MAIHIRYVYHGSLMTYSHVPMAMLMVFVSMLILLSVIARLTGWVVSSGEWHVILAMGIVGATLPCFGLTGYLLGYLSAPSYFATPENAWVRWLLPLVPSWLVPSNQSNAVSWFYEGLPTGATIPWDSWILPLLWWFTMIAAAFVTMACVATILRKQWVENERLVFPAMAPLMDMVDQPGNGKRRHVCRNPGTPPSFP